MASPVDADRRPANLTSSAAWQVLLPALSANDLVILIIRSGAAATITSIVNAVSGGPASWNQILSDSSDATDDQTYVYWGVWPANNPQSTGPTINWSTAIKGAVTAYRITGAADPTVQPPQVSAVSVFTTVANTANSPAISPTGGSKDYLFITCAGHGGATWGFVAPSGYVNTTGGGSTGGSAATNCQTGSASKQATTATEDPPVWTQHSAATVGGNAFTIAIHPAGPSTQFGSVVGITTFGRSVAGSKKTFSSIVRPFTFQASVAGDVFTPGVTYFGSLSMSVTFGSLIDGRRKTFGQIVAPFIFSKDVRGQRKTFGQTALSVNVSIVTAGVRLAKTLYGIVAMPIVFGAVISGSRKAFGQIVAPFIFSKDVRGQRKTFGQIASPFIFSKDVRAQRKTFGQTAFPITFSSTTSGFRPGIRQYGVVALPIIFGKDVKGQKRALGQIAMPIVFAKDVRGIRRVSGQVAMSIIFTKDVKAKRKTFSQISAPFIFGAVTQGRKRTFSKVAFPIGFNIDVKTGRVGTHGRIAFPIVVGLTTSGNLKLVGVVLNQAEMVYLGIEPVKAVYAGVEKVWPIFSPAKLSGLVIWFDAVDYTPSSWPNKGSGSAVNIVGSPAMTIGPTKNGLPVVRFKPNEGRVRMNGTGIDLNYTCVYVGRMWGLSSGGRIVTAQYPPSNLLIGYWNFNEDVCYVEGFLMPDARKPQTTNWHMYSLDGESLLPVTHEDYKPRFFSNGVFLSGDHGSTGGWKDTFSINGYAPTTIEETCECEIAEVVLYNRKLSDVDRQQVEAYLRDKWGI